MKALLNIFRNRLLDLSASNRSIFLPKAYKGKYSDLMHWDYLSAYSGLDMVKSLLAGKASIKIADVQHIKGEDLDVVLEEAKRLVRTHRLIAEETGSADFYVGWPFVEGVLKNGIPLRAPLAFFPYTLKIVGREIFLEKTAEGEAFWNRSLFLALSLYEEYQFDAAWLELPITGIEDTNEQDFRVALMDQLKQQGWSPSFEREFLSSNLSHFLPLKKEDLEAKHVPGHYQLKPYAVMGLFPQSTSYIHSDYAVLKKEFEGQAVDQVFSNFSAQEDEQQASSTLQFTPLPIDGSQENIITAVAGGKSLVVQGPPGSGKTQLICNLVAQFLGKGKKVLVVCQKKAALDVIYERLSQLDLSSFVSLVHDAVADKKEIYTKVADQVAQADEYKKQNIHPDTIVLEKEFSRVQSAIARLHTFFSKYKEALYDTSIGGDTAHALYLKSNRESPVVDLTHEFRAIAVNELEAKSHDFEQYFFYYQAIAQSLSLFQDVAAELDLTIDDKAQMVALLQQLPALNERLAQAAQEEEYLQYIPLSYAQEWMDQVVQWKSNALLYQHRLSHVALKSLAAESITQWEASIHEHFNAIGEEPALVPDEEHIQQWIRLLQQYKTSLWKRMLFPWLVKFKYAELRAWHASQAVAWDEPGFELLLNRLSALLYLVRLRKEWSAYAFISEAPFSKAGFIAQWNTWARVQQEKEDLFQIPALARLWSAHERYADRLARLEERVKERETALMTYRRYWNVSAIDRLFQAPAYQAQWIQVLNERFDYWLGYTQLKGLLNPFLWRSFEKTVQAFPFEDKAGLLEIWQQSLMRCWIEEKERVAPLLKTVSTPEWNLKEQELQQLITRRYSISLAFLKIKLKEWVYAGITYNRLSRQVTYRDLHYQVTKKRNVWPLRKIIATHEEEVLSLLPCWLVSPETASTVFPLHDVFDLVIFDEASQCFVEKAFPTLFRGKQVVVIGDRQQLKPNDLYRVRYKGDEEEDEIDHEVESLLDFSDRYFPSQMLQGHYRSKSESLIRFSNAHFYDHALRVIPDIAYIDQQALQYVKVQGIWENNTNRAEAEAVVDLVQKHMSTHPDKSIGIITFNYQQAFLIRERLEASIPQLPADLMVKNIENVQGDERDLIIFSIAYAKNAAGKMLSQFGSLSQDGGENRLNVAITRAREQVVVVSSILPQDLHAEHHKNKGVYLLAAYMRYVYEEAGLAKDGVKEEQQATQGLAQAIQAHFPERFAPTFFSDLRDRRQDNKVVFTDDRRYFYAPSVSDWHGYSKLMFAQKGWEVQHVYARNFWLDRARFWEQV